MSGWIGKLHPSWSFCVPQRKVWSERWAHPFRLEPINSIIDRYVLWSGGAWNHLDVTILIPMSPQATANSRDCHRVCEQTLSCCCAHTCRINPLQTYRPEIPVMNLVLSSPQTQRNQNSAISKHIFAIWHITAFPSPSGHSFFQYTPPVGALQSGAFFILSLSGYEGLYKRMIGSSISGKQRDSSPGCRPLCSTNTRLFSVPRFRQTI